MHKSVTFEWNFNMEEAKNAGVVLVAGTNSDGSPGIGYAFWDPVDNAWCSGYSEKPMLSYTPQAWIDDEVLSPFN